MTPIERLRALARETLRQYGTETAAGGEPEYPAWVDDVAAVCDELERLRALSGGQAAPQKAVTQALADLYGLVSRLSVPDRDYHIVTAAAAALGEVAPAAPQKAAPSDADLTALGQSVGLGPSLSVEFARALLARYGKAAALAAEYARGRADGWAAGWDEAHGKPAASAEPIPYADILAGMVRRLEGVDKNQPGYHHASGWNDALRQVMDVLRVNAAPVAAQAPAASNHVWEARPIDGSNSANVPSEAVCRKCGQRGGETVLAAPTPPAAAPLGSMNSPHTSPGGPGQPVPMPASTAVNQSLTTEQPSLMDVRHLWDEATEATGGDGLEALQHFARLVLVRYGAQLAASAEPIRLHHLAVADEHGLRWITGRKMPAGVAAVELYAMPDYGRAPSVVYAAPVAAQTWPNAGKVSIECDPERFGVASWHITDGHVHAVGYTPNEALNSFLNHMAAQAPAVPLGQPVTLDAATRIRNQALEEAALVCDKSSLQPAIAARIRAMKSAPTPPASAAPADNRPHVPEYVLTCVHAYGDARADDDGTSGNRIGELVTALRDWAATLRAPAAAGDAQRWERQAIAWLKAQAARQAQINQQYPLHAESYPTWRNYVTFADRLADELQRELDAAMSAGQSK